MMPRSPSPAANPTPYSRFPTPCILAIAGCSGSGKTTLAVELARTLPGLHFPLDHYYRDLSHLPHAERALQNFDDPALIESPLLAAHIAALAAGHAIERPLYDFSTHSRVPGQTETVTPGPYVLVEGIFALAFPEILPHYCLRIYVDAPDDVCFERRLKRDVIDRGRTPASVRRQYEATVRPSSLTWVQPTRQHADLVVDGTGNLDWKVERVLTELRQRGLLRASRD
jgi:uridine kinase